MRPLIAVLGFLIGGVCLVPPAAGQTQTLFDDFPLEFEWEQRGLRHRLNVTSEHEIPVTISFHYAPVEGVRFNVPMPRTQVIPPKTRSKTVCVGRRDRKMRRSDVSITGWFMVQPGTYEARHSDDAVYQLPVPEGYACEVRLQRSLFNRFIPEQMLSVNERVRRRQLEDAPDAFTEHAFVLDGDTPVLACRGGDVFWIRENSTLLGLGEPSSVVYIYHEDGTIGRYRNLHPERLSVAEGGEVEAGDQLGFPAAPSAAEQAYVYFATMKPYDGVRSMSIDGIVFETTDGRTALLDGGTYRKPSQEGDDGPARNFLRSIYAMERGDPDARPRSEFAADETVQIRIVFGYRVRGDFMLRWRYPSLSEAQEYDFVMVDERSTRITFALPDYRDCAGMWVAELFHGGELIGSTSFRVVEQAR